MEDPVMLKKNSRNQHSSRTFMKIVAPQAQSLNMSNRLKSERPNHHEIIDVNGSTPKHSANHQKQPRKVIAEEELVKYMSNLPSYLERRENCPDKVLNVGVLDWGRLEKWQCRQKQILPGSSRHSLSSSTSGSSFSTEGSSVHSTSDHNCPPVCQRMRRPSLQFHLMSSPLLVQGQHTKLFEENIENFQDVKCSQTNTRNEQGKFIRTVQSFSKGHPEIKLHQSNQKDLDLKICPQTETLANGPYDDVLHCMKERTKIRDGEHMKEAMKLQEWKLDLADQDVIQKSKTVLSPRDFPQCKHSGVPQLSESTMMPDQRVAEANRRSFSQIPKVIGLPAFRSDVPPSCTLPLETDRILEAKWCSVDGESIGFLPDSSQLVPCPANSGINPSCGRISKVKTSDVAPINSTSKQPLIKPDLKPSKVASEKVRSTSPFRRLSIGMGKMSKNFSSKEGSSMVQLNSAYNSAESSSKNAMASFCQDTSGSDTQNDTSRARSSPLRRLLDPLLKPKEPNRRLSGEPLQRDSTSTNRACKSSKDQLDSLMGNVQSGNANLYMTGCRTINVDDSSQDHICRRSAFQALLRVAIKNSWPLFTFAVGNERDILAATMKKLSTSTEDDYNCIYTFYAIQEANKKNGRWINQGGKGKGHDYIPKVLGQMKVSDSQFSSLTRQTYIEQSFTREFVLFAVELKHAEQQTLDFQPYDERAAIVVKVSKAIDKSTFGDGHQTDMCNDLQEATFNSTSGEHAEQQPNIGSQSLVSATVILPSSVHGLPSEGGPSSLLQRWRSGGSCDCGGWDLGCKLRILANQNQLIKKSSSSNSCPTTDKFEFISLGGPEEKQPVFSIAPFKDGIYSVEFNSSLTVLQAFSLCIAVIDSKKLLNNPEFSNLFEEKPSLENILAQHDGIRPLNRIDEEVPTRYVSYPPLSPVGRV